MAIGQPPQLAHAGLSHALEQHGNADHHGQQQAIQHTKHNDCAQRRQNHGTVTPPDKIWPHGLPGQRVAHRMNDDGRQHGLGNALHPRQKLPHQQRHHGAGHQPGSLAFGPGHFIGRTGGEPSPNRQPLKQRGSDIGTTQRQQVAVGIDSIAMAQGQRADGAIRLGIQNQRQRNGQLPHTQPVGPGQIRHRQVRTAQLQGAHRRYAPAFAVAQHVQRNTKGNDQQGPRNRLPAPQPVERQQSHDQHGKPQPVPLRQQVQQIPAEMQKVAVRGMHAHGQWQLLDHNRQRQTYGKAPQHRFGNELGDGTQLEQSGHHKHDARHQHHAHAHQRSVIGRDMQDGTRCRQQHRCRR